MKLIIENLVINYEQSGRGPILVLLHGWGRNLKNWAGVTENLKSSFQILAIDLPGFGESDIPPNHWGVLEYTDVVIKLLDKKGIDKFCIAGHSFGGRVAAKIAADFPTRVQKLILINSSGVLSKKSFEKIVIMILAKIGKYLIKLFSRKGFAVFLKKILKKLLGYSDYIQAGSMIQVFKNVASSDIVRILPKIISPTLIIWGKKDMITPYEDAFVFKKLIKSSRLEVIEGAGHFPFEEKPDEFVQVVRYFLTKT